MTLHMPTVADYASTWNHFHPCRRLTMKCGVVSWLFCGIFGIFGAALTADEINETALFSTKQAKRICFGDPVQ